MILEVLKNTMPVLDPHVRACSGTGRAAFVVSVMGAKNELLGAMKAAGGGIRLCATCTEQASYEAQRRGLWIEAVPIHTTAMRTSP